MVLCGQVVIFEEKLIPYFPTQQPHFAPDEFSLCHTIITTIIYYGTVLKRGIVKVVAVVKMVFLTLA